MSSLVAYHQQSESTSSDEDLTFVKVLARVMGKKLEDQGLENPVLPTSPRSKTLAADTLDALYPQNQDFYLSTSGLTSFIEMNIVITSLCLRLAGRIASPS